MVQFPSIPADSEPDNTAQEATPRREAHHSALAWRGMVWFFRSEVRAFDFANIATQLARIAIQDGLAAAQDIGPVRVVQGSADLLLHEEHGDAVVGRGSQRLKQTGDDDRGKPERQLVGQDDRGPEAQRPSQRQHLLLAARQEAYLAVAV
jgi:hypothetical protein